jgi:hypothetical protein
VSEVDVGGVEDGGLALLRRWVQCEDGSKMEGVGGGGGGAALRSREGCGGRWRGGREVARERRWCRN